MTGAPALDCVSRANAYAEIGTPLVPSLTKMLLLPVKTVHSVDGELVPLTSGSTRPVALTVTHAGIVKVELYSFLL